MSNNSAKTIIVKNARLSFVHLFVARAGMDGGEPKFSVNLLLDKKADADAIAAVKKAMADAVAETYAGKKAPTYSPDKVCLKDGTFKAGTQGYDDKVVFVTTSSKKRPVVVDRDRTPLEASSGKPYSGCYANAQIQIWVQDNKWGKRVNAEVLSVQFVKDGEPFGGGATGSADAFDELPDADDTDMGL